MKTAHALLSLGIGVTTCLAIAGDASAETGPKFGALPTGTVTQHPAGKAPASIPATEKIDGFFVAAPPKQMNENGRAQFVMVFASDEEAKDFNAGKGGFRGSREGVEGVCFSERAERDPFSSNDGTAAAEWSVSLAPTVNISPRWAPPVDKKGDPKRAFEVTAVHQERFVESAGKAQIDMIDAWVDPTTHGVRLIGKSSLPLAKMTTAPGGITVYAARDRQNVQFVAKKPSPPKTDGAFKPPTRMRDFRAIQMSRTPLVVEAPSGMSDASQCSFARVALRAQAGAAEMAVIESPVVFTAAEQPPVAPKESPLGALFGAAKDAKGEEDGPEIRIRPLKINLSSSWTSKDKEPVISVSLGWAGHERKM